MRYEVGDCTIVAETPEQACRKYFKFMERLGVTDPRSCFSKAKDEHGHRFNFIRQSKIVDDLLVYDYFVSFVNNYDINSLKPI